MSNGVFSIPLPAPTRGALAAESSGRDHLQPKSAAFVAGPENRLARVAAENFLLPASSRSAFNPLVIYGPQGCGKSHLAQGLAALWGEHYSHAHVCHVNDSRDLPHYHPGFNSGKSASRATACDDVGGHRFYQATTLVIVEDIDQVIRQRSAQRQLELLIDRLLRAGGKLVVTASTAPAALTHLSPMLRSRLAAGLVVHLATPRAATRHAMILSQAKVSGINLTEAALDELAKQLDTASVAELLNAIDKLARGTTPDASGSLDDTAVRQFFRLDRAPDSIQPPIPLNRIVKVVARHYGLKPADLRGRSRRRGVALARSMAMYLASRHAHYSLKKIGLSLGRRDHTTVMHGCRNIEKLLTSDACFQKLVDELAEKIQPEI